MKLAFYLFRKPGLGFKKTDYGKTAASSRNTRIWRTDRVDKKKQNKIKNSRGCLKNHLTPRLFYQSYSKPCAFKSWITSAIEESPDFWMILLRWVVMV